MGYYEQDGRWNECNKDCSFVIAMSIFISIVSFILGAIVGAKYF